MKPARTASLLVVPGLLAVILASGHAEPAVKAPAPHSHCAPAIVTPVAGEPGAYRIQTAHGTTIARRAAPVARATGATPVVEVRVFPASFDTDGDSLGTVHDSVIVAPGTIVRWVRAGPGFHTITSGVNRDDLDAGTDFNYFLDDTTNVIERVFTTPGRHPYFCFIHDPAMEGTVVVTLATAGVDPSGLPRRATFSRPPMPDPAHGALAFAIALPHDGPVSLTVHDLSGRIVARLQDGVLPAGEHPFRWDGRGADGRLLESGRYFIRLQAGSVRETRPVSIVH